MKLYTMKTNSKRLFNLLIISLFFSCRQIPEDEKFESENVSLENIALVNMTPVGIEWENSLTSANTDEQGFYGGGNILIYNKLHPENTIDKIGTFNNLQFARSSISSGVKYVVVVFDYNTGSIVESKIHTVGLIPEPLKLNIGKKYDLVIYSFNSSETPPRVSSINDRLSYEYSDTSKEFLYCKVSEYVPSHGVNTLNVVLKHRFSYVKFVINRNNFIGDIEKLESKLSGVHYKSGRININTGNFAGDGYRDINIPIKLVSYHLHESGYIPVILESGKQQGTFILEIISMSEMGSEKKIKNIPINIKSGTRHTYTIKLSGNSMTPKSKCEDPNADNYGGTLPCKYTLKCTDPNATNTGQPQPCVYPQKCTDPNADNYGGALPCKYTPKCTDPNATNIGQPLPCKYPPPPPKCTDPEATNNGGLLPCRYPPVPQVIFGNLPKTYTPGTCCKSASNFCFNTYVNDYSIIVSINNYDSKLHKVEVSSSGSASWVTSVLKHKSFVRNGNSNTWTWTFGRHKYVSTDKFCRPGSGSLQYVIPKVTIKSTKTGKVVATGTGIIEIQD